MVFENGLKNIQAAAYNGARTVYWKNAVEKFQPIVLEYWQYQRLLVDDVMPHREVGIETISISRINTESQIVTSWPNHSGLNNFWE